MGLVEPNSTVRRADAAWSLSLDPPIGWMGQAGDEWLADRFAGEHVKAESVTAGGERGDDTVEEPPRCW
jgi:hypothetical protein